MLGFVTFIHVIVCVLLILIILMQSGRGGGLTESFASAETVFGAKTNSLLIKTTTIFATFFLITCLGLAFLSSRKSKSLMSDKIAVPQTQLPVVQKEIGPESASAVGENPSTEMAAPPTEDLTASQETKSDDVKSAMEQNTSSETVVLPEIPSTPQEATPDAP